MSRTTHLHLKGVDYLKTHLQWHLLRSSFKPASAETLHFIFLPQYSESSFVLLKAAYL